MGRGTLKHYRVYKLDEDTGQIVKGKDVDAPDDNEAMKQAQEDEDCPVCEVWQSTKMVGTIAD